MMNEYEVFSTVITKKMREDLDRVAKEKNVSRSAVLRWILDEYFTKEENTNG